MNKIAKEIKYISMWIIYIRGSFHWVFIESFCGNKKEVIVIIENKKLGIK